MPDLASDLGSSHSLHASTSVGGNVDLLLEQAGHNESFGQVYFILSRAFVSIEMGSCSLCLVVLPTYLYLGRRYQIVCATQAIHDMLVGNDHWYIQIYILCTKHRPRLEQDKQTARYHKTQVYKLLQKTRNKWLYARRSLHIYRPPRVLLRIRHTNC
jgi:hypothetical protein